MPCHRQRSRLGLKLEPARASIDVLIIDDARRPSATDISFTSSRLAQARSLAISGSFTLNFNQVSPAGTGSLLGTLSGSLGFNTGIGTLSFATTTIDIAGFTYTLNPSYTIALPVTGVGGSAGTGTTTIQGTVTGGPAVPDGGSTLTLLGAALLGLGALRRRLHV